MNSVLEAQTTSTADTSLLQPCGSVSSAGNCASKDVARSRLSVCTALDSPQSPKPAAIGSPSLWSRTESPGPSLLSCIAPAALAGSALAESAASESGDAAKAVAVSTLQLKRPESAAHSRSSYALVHSELLAASSSKSLLATASLKASSDRSSCLNSPSLEQSSPADLLGAADGALDELLSGKFSRARTSMFAVPASADSGRSSATAAAARGGAAGAAAAERSSSIVVGSSNQIADRPVRTATSAARLSLAQVGLLAAPGVGLLPGSPLADASAAGSAAAAAIFGSGGSSTGPGRHSAAGSRQQPHQQRRSVAAAALSVSPTGEVGGTMSELSQQQQVFLLDTSATGAMRNSFSGNVALPQPLLHHHHHQQQQPGTTGSGHTAAVPAVAAVHGSRSKKATEQKQEAAAAAAAQRAGCNEDSSSHHGTQLGTAAFRASGQAQANRVGRIKVIPSDAPGPAHYWPHHVLTDKHVPAAHIVLPSSSRPAPPSRIAAGPAVPADANTANMVGQTSTRPTQHEQQQEQGRQTQTSTALSSGAKAGLHNTAAVRTSATDGTPRLADEGPLRGVQPYRVHPKSKVQPGSSAFKAVSREQLQRRQRHASAGAVAERGVDYFREGYDSLTRSRSVRGPVPIFAKQTARPASPAAYDCTAALGPGSYYRSGNLPFSNIGADLPAGHGHSSNAHGVLVFDKYSSRPGTAPPAALGHEADRVFAGAVGLWGWPAAAGGCVSQTGHLTSTFTHSMVPQQHEGTPSSSSEAAGVAVARKQQPSSTDALAYMRRQCPTDLCAPADEQQDRQGDWEQQHGSCELNDVIMQQLQQQRLQQQLGRPCSGLQQQRRCHAGIRPATACAVMVKAATAAGMCCTSPADCTTKLASSPAKQRPSSACARPTSGKPRPGLGTGGQQDLKMGSSMGCALRTKGGAWSTSSRSAAAKVLRAMSVGSVIPPASVAVVQPGTELSYDPNPALLGHMHRSPGWRLPPNRTATSKKWAQMAAKAGLQ